MSSPEKTELRQLAPTVLLQALDAIAMVKGMDRNEYVVKVLHEHAVKEGHKTTMRIRMLRGNTYMTEAPGSEREV